MTARKTNIDQKSVNNACNKIATKGDKVTVSKIIENIGGSFSTVGKMVKIWKQKKKEAEGIEAVQLPEEINKAMKTAVVQLWETANQLLGEEVKRTQEKADKYISELKEELNESLAEIKRLEEKMKAIESNQIEVEKLALKIQKRHTEQKTENKIIKNQLKERDNEIKRLRDSSEKLQNELIEIAKQSNNTITDTVSARS